MKHYTNPNSYEIELVNPRMRRFVGHKAKSLAAAKHGFRRRERAALKRMTAELVAYELDGYRDDERAYWWGVLDGSKFDWNEFEIAEVSLRESGQWTHDRTKIFAAAYLEIRNRSKAAYEEWLELA